MAADELSKDIEQAADICALALEGGDGEQMAYLLAELVERHGAQGVNGAVESLGQMVHLLPRVAHRRMLIFSVKDRIKNH